MCWVTNLTMDCLEKEKTQRNIYCVSNSNGAVKIQWAHHSLFLVLFCSNKLHLVQYFHSKSLYWILAPTSINKNLDVTEIAHNVANLNDLDGKFSTARPTLDEQIFPSSSFADWSICMSDWGQAWEQRCGSSLSEHIHIPGLHMIWSICMSGWVQAWNIHRVQKYNIHQETSVGTYSLHWAVWHFSWWIRDTICSNEITTVNGQRYWECFLNPVLWLPQS